jgi:hypothetical protein
LPKSNSQSERVRPRSYKINGKGSGQAPLQGASMGLRQQLAEHGFESNDDYEFQVRSLFQARIDHLRCLQIAGESGRRKTALASALANALGYPRILYLDFSLPEPPSPPVNLPAGEDAISSNEAPLGQFERVVLEACAFSEAERCVLILDQLQAADFREQIRLFQFVQSCEWTAASGSVKANPKHLLLMLISEQPIYHSLAHLAYRLWADASGGRFDYRPEDFGLGLDARTLFDAFAALFDAIDTVPTPSEFRRILDDALANVRTAEQLRHSIFGWMERIDRSQLFAPELIPAVAACVQTINQFVGIDEIEMGS